MQWFVKCINFGLVEPQRQLFDVCPKASTIGESCLCAELYRMYTRQCCRAHDTAWSKHGNISACLPCVACRKSKRHGCRIRNRLEVRSMQVDEERERVQMLFMPQGSFRSCHATRSKENGFFGSPQDIRGFVPASIRRPISKSLLPRQWHELEWTDHPVYITRSTDPFTRRPTPETRGRSGMQRVGSHQATQLALSVCNLPRSLDAKLHPCLMYASVYAEECCRESVQHKYSARAELDGISICKGQRTKGRAVAFELFWQCFRCCTGVTFDRIVRHSQVNTGFLALKMILDEQSHAWKMHFEPGIEHAGVVRDQKVANSKIGLEKRSRDQNAGHENAEHKEQDMSSRFMEPDKNMTSWIRRMLCLMRYCTSRVDQVPNELWEYQTNEGSLICSCIEHTHICQHHKCSLTCQNVYQGIQEQDVRRKASCIQSWQNRETQKCANQRFRGLEQQVSGLVGRNRSRIEADRTCGDQMWVGELELADRDASTCFLKLEQRTLNVFDQLAVQQQKCEQRPILLSQFDLKMSAHVQVFELVRTASDARNLLVWMQRMNQASHSGKIDTETPEVCPDSPYHWEDLGHVVRAWTLRPA